MASLKTLITLTTLKKIPHNVLEEKLAYIKSELENRNIWTGKGIKYQNLTRYLQENCPRDLEDFICSFSLIAKPELYERIVEKLNSLGIETSPSDDVETIAARLADRDIHSCNIIAARKMASESHSYSHYIPSVPHSARQLTNEEIEKLKNGVKIDDYVSGKAKVKVIKYDVDKNESRLEIIIHEGKNREVRKMCEAIGKKVLALHRTKIGNIEVKPLELGKYRFLTAKEVESLIK